jgi:hypothetical protein
MSVPETPNLHLKKPEYTDPADVFDMNDNMDILDQVIPDIWKKIYPVGAIYMSTVNTSPATLFGGTWVQIKDRFLLSAGDTYTAGSTGGAASKSYTPAGTVGNHTLTASEIPSHAHSMSNHVHSVGAHSHGLNSHVHSVGAHSHGLNSHVHTVGAHSHGLNGHIHTINAHVHGLSQDNIPLATIVLNDYHTVARYYEGGPTSYYAGKATVTQPGGSGSTGPATGNTADSAAFNSGAASGNTANSTAFNTGAAVGSTENSTAFNSGGPSVANTGNAGGGGGHNHGFTGTAASINVMPPYLTVYMWKRTA